MIQKIQFAFLTLLMAGTALIPAAKADEWNKQTVLTFKKAVEVPGHTLPAGSYIFQLADRESGRSTVQIYSQDTQSLLATIVAVPEYRIATDTASVTLENRPEGAPIALHSWFYPGDNQGVRFVYPKSEK